MRMPHVPLLQESNVGYEEYGSPGGEYAESPVGLDAYPEGDDAEMEDGTNEYGGSTTAPSRLKKSLVYGHEVPTKSPRVFVCAIGPIGSKMKIATRVAI
eukprot:832381-Prorocentrum_minimum.AAC.3